ncbi:Detected protein of confused Function [Hibiscus syriacus]|uniref:Detected protein of confused Function n=1 Tax=Hibiscus syriacus TaxID=106335 RepID=A0A6A3B2G4_HIBSY|nr:Detected protein of confused Function [Hibiscus syriacus]
MTRHLKEFHDEELLSSEAGSEKQYVCQEAGCGKVFKFASSTSEHMNQKGLRQRELSDFEGCLHTFSTKSNIRQHVKAVHEELKPYACSFGCGMKFSYKHVRDKHEKSGCHVYTPGDFLELDQQFRSRPRGGRKRTCPTVEMLIRKRVIPPQMDMMDLGQTPGCS